jgi:pyridoxamine 5'-phosphate oxidase
MNLLPHPAPFARFGEWLAAAEAAEPNDPNAMAVATATPDAAPSLRVVLLKAWDERGFVFYTNLDSQKGSELAGNPQTHLNFHWKSLQRQVRIGGRAELVSDAEADAYFATRPRESQLGAWASLQSRPLPDRSHLRSPPHRNGRALLGRRATPAALERVARGAGTH